MEKIADYKEGDKVLPIWDIDGSAELVYLFIIINILVIFEFN